MSPFLVSEQRHIPAAPQRLFDIIANPAMHPVIDGSGTVAAARAGNPDRLCLGAVFGMDMRLGASYRITNRVVEFDEPRRIGWRHFNGHIWRYQFDPAGDGGTLVTEQWDATRVWNRLALAALGFPHRNRRGIQATLDRLAQIVADQPTDDGP